MNFVALVSGGKDGVYSACKLIDEGNKLVGIIHIQSSETYSDSYMYQTVGSEIAVNIGKCFGVPLIKYKSKCRAVNQELNYEVTTEDEVEDLFIALKLALEQVSFEAVCSGAILSRYQSNRVSSVCSRLNLKSVTPIWNMDQIELLNDMIEYGIDARIVKIASPALSKECLGMNLSEIREYMNNKNYKYGMNYCGEGGEYESIVLDCKHFTKKIIPQVSIEHAHPDNKTRDCVYYMEYDRIDLQDK